MIYNPETNTISYEEVLKIPEFKALVTTLQNILWHKEGNAYIHTCMVVQCILDYINSNVDKRCEDINYRQVLVYSALLHDIGKTVTTEKGEDGLYHCKDHAIKGVDIAKNILEKYILEIPEYCYNIILSLVRYHMHPLYIMKHRNKEQFILKLANNLNANFETLLLLKKCDCEGSIFEQYDGYKEILEDVRILYYEICSFPENTRVTLKKIADVNGRYRNNHPNSINVGYVAQGTLVSPVTKNMRVSLGQSFSTSLVEKIIDKNHFQTKNSVYKITEIK